MSANPPCSIASPANASRSSTTRPASRATAARLRRFSVISRFTIVDTAGLEESDSKSLSGRMRAQTEIAIAAADVVLFLVDARAGVTPHDLAFADLVRRAGKPVIVAANKSEGRTGAVRALEAFDLGLGDPVAISAEHDEGLSDLRDAIRAALPENADGEGQPAANETAPAEATQKPLRLAVVGRPNAGKSTLINWLLGEDRLLTGAESGITRDAVAVPLEWKGRKLLVHDTAGLRRRSKVEGRIEALSVADALEAIRFAEVVILLTEAMSAFEEQDLRIASLIAREGRALVIGANKWDLTPPRPSAIGRLRDEAERLLPQIKGLPVVAVSGLTGAGVDRLMEAVIATYAVWNRRIATTPLNRWFEAARDAHPPPAVAGRRLKLNYITQPKTRPPSFVLFCTRADAVPEDYRRYLVNSLREAFDLPGVPIRLTLREKTNPYANQRKR